MRLEATKTGILLVHQGERVAIDTWGEDALRVRATPDSAFHHLPWALTEDVPHSTPYVSIFPEGGASNELAAMLRSGRIRVDITRSGILSFYRDGDLILREDMRDEGAISKQSSALKRKAREWRGIIGGSEHALKVRFESDPEEMLFGMGQYQQLEMNLKGCILELMQRNSQVSVPFALSSLGYGFLWNNPAVGQVVFGRNYTEWTALSTKQLDYWITVGDGPQDILRRYTEVTGRPGDFPSDLLGLWQCKLRYRTQDEVLAVARRCRAEGIALSEIIIDFFHWTYQGDWKFDPVYWPDPKAMVDELHEMGTRVMVSVWPSVDRRSRNYAEMRDLGLLIRTERGSAQTYDYQGDCAAVDAFSDDAREYIWNKCRESYYDIGIDGFWIDNTEPDFVAYDLENYRYSAGPALACSNVYPQLLSRAFYDGMRGLRDAPVVNLVRSAWAGSQKYGNIVWSGDIPSTFASLAAQIQCGLNMGLAGIPWWTTDIGGFITQDWEDPVFRELLVRWFQFAVYSPVLRMHGNRGPHTIPPLDDRDWGGGYLFTGHDNELWSYGEENYEIFRRYLGIRESLRSYLEELYGEARISGAPLMRTMFFEFPDDRTCWYLQDQYMLGGRYLVAPVLHPQATERTVYIPAEGDWLLTLDGTVYHGSGWITCPAPLNYMPVLERLDAPGA